MIKWNPPDLPDLITLPKGDMPGDKICIDATHVSKAKDIFPVLLAMIEPQISIQTSNKSVIAVHGGSGVGKSEIASLLRYYLDCMSIGCYIMSGDNYPHRIPRLNDLERWRIYREYALKGLVQAGEYNTDRLGVVHQLQDEMRDADQVTITEHPWIEVYQRAGQKALADYLGSSAEIDFAEINFIINQFRKGTKRIHLKRMGREENEHWYDVIDFSNVQVLLIEWTHGNSPLLQGVDIPILLDSTPQETLEHRRSRNRDGSVDSAFTSIVLAAEQEKIRAQAQRARIIMKKNGEMSFHENG